MIQEQAASAIYNNAVRDTLFGWLIESSYFSKEKRWWTRTSCVCHLTAVSVNWIAYDWGVLGPSAYTTSTFPSRTSFGVLRVKMATMADVTAPITGAPIRPCTI